MRATKRVTTHQASTVAHNAKVELAPQQAPFEARTADPHVSLNTTSLNTTSLNTKTAAMSKSEIASKPAPTIDPLRMQTVKDIRKTLIFIVLIFASQIAVYVAFAAK